MTDADIYDLPHGETELAVIIFGDGASDLREALANTANRDWMPSILLGEDQNVATPPAGRAILAITDDSPVSIQNATRLIQSIRQQDVVVLTIVLCSKPLSSVCTIPDEVGEMYYRSNAVHLAANANDGNTAKEWLCKLVPFLFSLANEGADDGCCVGHSWNDVLNAIRYRHQAMSFGRAVGESASVAASNALTTLMRQPFVNAGGPRSGVAFISLTGHFEAISMNDCEEVCSLAIESLGTDIDVKLQINFEHEASQFTVAIMFLSEDDPEYSH